MGSLSLRRRFAGMCFLLGIFGFFAFVGGSVAADVAPRVGLRKVTVRGEIGRRIDITVNNNLLDRKSVV